MSNFDYFVSQMEGAPTTPSVAAMECMKLFDGLAELIKAHESEIEAFELEEGAMEGANYSRDRNLPVFIILTKGHTALSKIIFAATHDEHSHASIAFDVGLEKMYSFGSKKINPREMGFMQTSATSDIWGEIPTEFDVYVTFVNAAQKEKMMKTLEYFTKNADHLKYHWTGLVKIFFNIKSKNEKAWICSRFVATILGAGVELDKDPSLYRPSQLQSVPNIAHLISGPSIRNYDVKAAKKQLEKIKRQ